MAREIRVNKLLEPKATYSHATVSGNLMFVAGQVAINPKNNEFLEGTIGEQTKLALENLEAVVKAAGACLSDVIKVNAYITSREHFASFDATYRNYFEKPYPARTSVVALLPNEKVLVEIEAVVELKDR